MSGAVPPPAARPPERAARVPRPACPGRGRCGRGDPAPAPQRAPLRAGVARCGGGGRASPGGVPSTIVRGAWGQALSLSRLPAHCWVGCRGSLGVCGVCGVCAVRVVVRGAALPLVLRCPPLRCLGAVLCSPCARRVPSPERAPCSFAGYPLFLSRLRCSLPFPLPLSLACTFSLPPLCCVSLSFSLSARASSFVCGTCVERGGGVNGRAAAAVLSRHGTSSWLVRHATCVCDRLARRFIAPLAPVLSPHPFGRYLYSLPVPRARRDMQHTCFFPHYLNVS